MTEAAESDEKEIDARLGDIDPPMAREVLIDHLAGGVSPPITLARLLLILGYVSEVGELLAEVAVRWGRPLNPRLRELAELLQDHREGCEKVAVMLREHPEPTGPPVPDEVIPACREFFDRAVRRSEVGSVAAYSLNDPDLLGRGTQEVVDLFERWELLGRHRRTLEIGCGIGRMQEALAPRVGEAHGIDISPGMIAAAKRRCAGLPNVHLRETSGHDLSPFEPGVFDMVYAVDSFPYLFRAGLELIAKHFDEAARVLVPKGDFVLFNFSYRDSLAADRRDVRRLAHAAGFQVMVGGSQPFEFWDGIAFRMRKM
jgi:SAM-dependent methyltransferase